jgi:hypothetical protein
VRKRSGEAEAFAFISDGKNVPRAQRRLFQQPSIKRAYFFGIDGQMPMLLHKL